MSNQEVFNQYMEPEWKIEKIVATCCTQNTRYYKVKLIKYGWYTADSMQSLQSLLDLYWQTQIERNSSQDKIETIQKIQCSVDTSGIIESEDRTQEKKSCGHKTEMKTLNRHEQEQPGTGLRVSESSIQNSSVTDATKNSTTVPNLSSTDSSISPSPTMDNVELSSVLTTPVSRLALSTHTTPISSVQSVDSLLTAHEMFSVNQTDSDNGYNHQQQHADFDRAQCFLDTSSTTTDTINECLGDTVTTINRCLENNTVPDINRCLDNPLTTMNRCIDTSVSLLEEPVDTEPENDSVSVALEDSIESNGNHALNDSNILENSDSIGSSKDFSDVLVSSVTDYPAIVQQHNLNVTNFTMTNTGDEKKFKCNECGRSFGRKTSLKRHAIIHTGQKPYGCEYCDKSFNQNAILQRHLLIHKQTKLFQCEVCHKTFIEKSALRRHCVTHSTAPPSWKCSTCGKEFRLKEYLTKHEFLHKGIKPYACQICERSFADSSALKRHASTHSTAVDSVECSNCLKRFKNSRSLKKHMATCKVFACL